MTVKRIGPRTKPRGTPLDDKAVTEDRDCQAELRNFFLDMILSTVVELNLCQTPILVGLTAVDEQQCQMRLIYLSPRVRQLSASQWTSGYRRTNSSSSTNLIRAVSVLCADRYAD